MVWKSVVGYGREWKSVVGYGRVWWSVVTCISKSSVHKKSAA